MTERSERMPRAEFEAMMASGDYYLRRDGRLWRWTRCDPYPTEDDGEPIWIYMEGPLIELASLRT